MTLRASEGLSESLKLHGALFLLLPLARAGGMVLTLETWEHDEDKGDNACGTCGTLFLGRCLSPEPQGHKAG